LANRFQRPEVAMKPALSLSLLSLLALVACNESPAYGPPEDSGLVGVRPFPADGSVCQVIGENDLTNQFLDDSATLVGCPKSETGAIADRTAEGGRQVGEIGDWVLLSVPN
jgi:hypothetical protein